MFLSLQKIGTAQESSSNYFKKSIDGYIHLYFDKQYFLVDEDCTYKTYTRAIKYDKNKGGFNSFFIDYYNNNTPALTGNYIEGKKEGVFKQFYPNGNRHTLSYFKDNLPVGEWQYFYPSGNPWITVKFKNQVPYILEYWNESGIKRVKSGKGKFQFTQDVYDYNYYGYTGVIVKGRVKNGRPVGIWSNFLDYPEGEDQLIRNILFSKDGLVKSSNSFPKQTSQTPSMIQLIPTLLFENTSELKYKNCTIDDQKQFNLYLQNYINTSLPLIWKFDEVPLENSFTATVNINQYGQSTLVEIQKDVPLQFSIALAYVLKSVTYWIPSFSEGKTIDDSLEITFFKAVDGNKNTSFAYPTIKRKKESLTNR